LVYDLGAFAGIYYDSRHGLGLENWALFEFKAIINPLIPVQRVSKNDRSLKQALEILHLAVAESILKQDSTFSRAPIIVYRRGSDRKPGEAYLRGRRRRF
jgi:hypothetical protein